jgi:hypothetical protein
LVPGGEQIVIPARRNWLILLFLAFWLTVWTFGGIAALYEVMTNFSLFLVFWLCGWAAGWLFAATTIAWQINGAETLRVVGGDLEVRHSAVGLSKSWWFRGSEIRNLRAGDTPALPFGWSGLNAPLIFWRRWGSVRFTHGARTIYLAPALDEAEGALIVETLQRALPRTAVDS